MIDARQFEERLFPWIDGALPADSAREMEEYCRVHPEARERAAAERAFEQRLRGALVADARGHEVALRAFATIRGEEAGVAAAAPRSGRLLSFPRWGTGVAAAAALVVGVMWLNCIPPFECSVLEAMEKAADAPAERTEELAGGPCEWVSVAGAPRVQRSHVQAEGGGDACLLVYRSDEDPSFRREFRDGGDAYWVADRGGRTLVAYREDRSLYCFVGDQPEAQLMATARRFRKEHAGAATTTHRTPATK